jgi:hypothetical protein
MAVVINDFEVVAEAAHQGKDTPARGSDGESKVQASSPRDIERIMHRLGERLARVRAH